MISLQEILANPIVNRIGLALLHSVWQCTAVAVLFAVVMVALRKSRPNVRYNIALCALLLMVLVPAVTVFTVRVDDVAAHTPVAIDNAAAVAVNAVGDSKAVTTDTDALFPVAEVSKIAATNEIAVSTNKNTADADSAGISQKIESVLPHFAVVWIAGVLVLSIWHLGGWAQLRKLRRVMVKPVEERVLNTLERLANSLAVTRTVEIVESALVTVPTVIGAFKPVILLPASALSGLSADQLEMILAHELAHIKRNDYLANLIQTAIDILLFYHPAVWYISKVIRNERENCCDDMAVMITGDNIKYARALATMEEIKIENRRLAVAATGGSFFDRIARLVGKEQTRKSKPAWQTAVITMLVIFAAVVPLCFAMNANASDSKAKALVENFFKNNYRDITDRKTIEWGEQTKDEKGNISIRYKYEATIWDKDKVINNAIFTFDKNGKFVSVEKLKDTKTKEGLQTLVIDFFGKNFRDITARKTIEWSEPVQHDTGNASIRYKYEAMIKAKGRVTKNQTFTFDKTGDFVSVVTDQTDQPKEVTSDTVIIEPSPLDTEIDFSFVKTHTTFKEVVDHLRDQKIPGLSIVVMWKELSEVAFVEPDDVVGIEGLGEMPLKIGLDIILKSIGGSIAELTYTCKDGVLIIQAETVKKTAGSQSSYYVQKMIDTAEPNSTLIVPKGHYIEGLTINKPLTLKGSGFGDCIIEYTGNSPAISIDTAGKGDVAIEGLTIKWKLNTSDRIEYASAVAVKDCKATIENCEFVPLGNFRQSPTAVRAYGFSKMFVNNCKFTGFDYTVCFSEGTEGAVTECVIKKCRSQGIILYRGAKANVAGNIVTGSGKHAVRSTGGTLNMVNNLIINNANRGVYLGNKTGRGRIANNVLIGNGVGISGFASADYEIENNIIRKSGFAAIAMLDSCRLTIVNNIFQDNPTGVLMFKKFDKNNNKLLGNTYHNNKEATKDINAAGCAVFADPLFNNADNGNFSLKPGMSHKSKHGLTNSSKIEKLWKIYLNSKAKSE